MGGTSGKRYGVLSKVKVFMQRNRLGELMVMNGHLTSGQLRYALALQRDQGQNLGQILIDNKLVSRSALYSVLLHSFDGRLHNTDDCLCMPGI